MVSLTTPGHPVANQTSGRLASRVALGESNCHAAPGLLELGGNLLGNSGLRRLGPQGFDQLLRLGGDFFEGGDVVSGV